jgi:hypothetical protein
VEKNNTIKSIHQKGGGLRIDNFCIIISETAAIQVEIKTNFD